MINLRVFIFSFYRRGALLFHGHLEEHELFALFWVFDGLVDSFFTFRLLRLIESHQLEVGVRHVVGGLAERRVQDLEHRLAVVL